MTPPFLAYLGLREDADERAIKRAYARQLKQIDQAADPAGFQALREAYEAALHWHHTRAAREAQAAQDEGEMPLPDDTASDAADGPIDTAAAQSQAPAPAELPPLHAEVIEVVNGFMAGLGSHEGDKTAMLQALAACLDDPRLQGLDARDLFEWFIARSLAEGWRPGHEVLLVAAIEFFDWGHDRRRLMRFGRVGQALDESIAERMVFDGLPLPVHTRQKEVIRLLRRQPRAEDPAQARLYQQDLEGLVQNFPNWLWMIVSAERVQQWRQWASDPSGEQAASSDEPSPQGSWSIPPDPQPSAPEKVSTMAALRTIQTSVRWFLGLLLVVAVVIGLLQGSESTVRSWDAERTSTRPAEQPTRPTVAELPPLQSGTSFMDVQKNTGQNPFGLQPTPTDKSSITRSAPP